MARPLKITGFSQGLFEVSSTKKETLGRLRFTEDGRAFRYGRAAATALPIGYATYGIEGTANHQKQANTGSIMNIGDTRVMLLLGATACTANQYDDGYLQIYDGAAAAVGQNLLISSHDTSAGSALCQFVLKEPIVAKCIATDTYSLIPNPWGSITASGALAHLFTGVTICAVPASNYAWFQTGGICNVLNQGGTAIGTEVNLSATTGATITTAGVTSMEIGCAISIAAVSAKYNPVYLNQF